MKFSLDDLIFVLHNHVASMLLAVSISNMIRFMFLLKVKYLLQSLSSILSLQAVLDNIQNS